MVSLRVLFAVVGINALAGCHGSSGSAGQTSAHDNPADPNSPPIGASPGSGPKAGDGNATAAVAATAPGVPASSGPTVPPASNSPEVSSAITLAPSGLTYASASSIYSLGLAIVSNQPLSGGGKVASFSVTPPLPSGLSLDTATGIISGTPTSISPFANYSVTASNANGTTTASLNISVTTSATISTLAGNGIPSYADYTGPATGAGLRNPSGIAIDSSGNLYIADFENGRVRKVTPDGQMSTIAGNGGSRFSGDNGPATSASLNYPYSVAIDTSGNLYIGDYFNYRIRMTNTNGVISTVAGGGSGQVTDGRVLATSVGLGYPGGLAVDNKGNIYFGDGGSGSIRKVTPEGLISTIAGGGTGALSAANGVPATSVGLGYNDEVAVDANGNLYISDLGTHRVLKVTTDGLIFTVAGNGSGTYAGDGGPATSASLNGPRGMTVDKGGNVYIADGDNNRIRKVTVGGIITTVAGNGSGTFAGDNGSPLNASLKGPRGVAVDSSGNLYISDSGNNRIRLVTPTAP